MKRIYSNLHCHCFHFKFFLEHLKHKLKHKLNHNSLRKFRKFRAVPSAKRKGLVSSTWRPAPNSGLRLKDFGFTLTQLRGLGVETLWKQELHKVYKIS